VVDGCALDASGNLAHPPSVSSDRHQIEVIEREWSEVCDLAGLTDGERRERLTFFST
jgi:hypothetical protein